MPTPFEATIFLKELIVQHYEAAERQEALVPNSITESKLSIIKFSKVSP